MKTLTGKTREEVVEKMTAVLSPDAYSEVGGAKYLTDINPAYLKEVATECFGLVGEGWYFEYDTEDMTVTFDGQPSAWLKKLSLYYVYVDDEGQIFNSRAIHSPGGSDNRKVGDAMKGAVTDALGKCFSNLLWQIGIYKGEFSHKNVPTGNGQPPSKPQGQVRESAQRQEETAEGHKRSGGSLPPEKIRDVILAKVDVFGDYDASTKFYGFVRGMMGQLFEGSQDADGEVHSVLNYLFGVLSTNDLNGAQVKALRDWIDAAEINGKLMPNAIAISEARSMVSVHRIGEGQQELEEEGTF